MARGVGLALGLIPAVAHPTTLLTVDLSSTVRPVGHVASGSLYGALETQPADVNGLIAPLHPNVFNNPAADVQQPIGDAIVVAGRVAPLGARVSIRLADWFPSWPYAFTNMTDWFTKIGQTVSRRKSANLTNIYAYEIWNEPDGTWKSTSLAFNDFWQQTYAQLRQLDPTVKITGPSTSYYNQSFIQSFLSYCKTNGCLPDIVGWHELSGGNVTGNIQAYRSLEKQLGIGPLPITINEYSGAADLTVEGQPGASASLIAKFERLGVDSACISFWDVAHPGRLGSLLATSTDTNGGWWFYKWYGDMAGNMVSTTPAAPSNSAALDGFANLDGTGKSASILFGGVNDGSVQVVIKGFSATAIFGSPVHVVVEHTPFVNRTTVVKSTDLVSTADVAVANDQIAISVANTNNSDGYRISLTPAGGGASGSGGAAGANGAGGKGGVGGSGQLTGSGGAAGRAGTGGLSGSGGGAGIGTGGSFIAGTGGGAGSKGAAGTSGTGGLAGNRGSPSGVGGTPGRDGGGTAGQVGGEGGVGAGAGGTHGEGGTSPTTSGDVSSGCSCGVGEASPPATGLSLVIAVGLLAGWRSRRRRGR
jgi:MYXO-CTERM domain-containing protein